jgi:hypothetical protein
VDEIPYPPDCAICDGRVGLWEPVLVSTPDGEERTTWLRLARDGEPFPDLIRHEECDFDPSAD